MKEKIEARITELEKQKERALEGYNDKEAEISAATQQMSEMIRKLKSERSMFALEAAKCQQSINDLKALLAEENGGGK
ncbi:MAG TPA: hypothetical protein VM123_16410 [archaeon]|nr:hypothetical protein [archaeon]